MTNWNEIFYYKGGILYWKINPKNNHTKIGDKAGFLSQNGYFQVKFEKITRNIHRIIYEMFIGEIPMNMEVDHIDGDKLNNQLDNLRLVNKSENGRNRGKNKNN